ncbi:MAG: organoarsenical effux MFS transporter ArsJ [Alphaproteobacteria bacterium]
MNVRAYGIVTGAYWGQTITDGALHMLVLLHFYTLGFTPFQIAFLFVLYELMGVITNLLGGWIAARFGLTTTLYAGLVTQIAALLALAALDPDWPLVWSVAYATLIQGLAGVAKDLTKMSSKSAIKLVVPEGEKGGLFKWVALLTGSKNAMKGAGFFVGGLLLATLGFVGGLFLLAAGLAVILALTVLTLPRGMGRAKAKTPITRLLAKAPAINRLSVARVFLFGARDIWFVVGVPIFLYEVAGWTFLEVSTFLALWVIGYGAVQAAAPRLIERSTDGLAAEVKAARAWALALAATPALVALGLTAILPLELLITHGGEAASEPGVIGPGAVIVLGLGLFGAVFAVNSSLHSYLILAYSKAEDVAMDVGFYYMANAAGRLVGCLLSGWSYQVFGVAGCLGLSTAFLLASWAAALTLPTGTPRVETARA